MQLHGPVSQLDDTVTERVLNLARLVNLGVGHTSITEPQWQQVRRGGDERFAAAWGVDAEGALVTYSQLVRTDGHPNWAAEVLIHPSLAGRTADLGAPLLGALLRWAASHGAGHVHYWATAATPAHAELAARCGLLPHRTLHQMQRPLPADAPKPIELRPFRRGEDEDAVLEVNSAAFATHPDQGGMTREVLEDRLDQPWFDPEGFLLHERDGRLAGFCWTKLFTGTKPVLGEIHIICVHPDFVGHGLGKSLVLAGLAYLHERGADMGMLFVEGDNDAALDLYRGLGFTVTRTDQAFGVTV